MGPDAALGQTFLMPIGGGYGLPMLVTNVVMETTGSRHYGSLVDTRVTFTAVQTGGPVLMGPQELESA